MNGRHTWLRRLAAPLRGLRAWLTAAGEAEGTRYCCGVGFEPRRPENRRSTPSSCCGVRV